MSDEIYFILSSMLAAFIHGAFGFGFPLVATPLLAFVFPLQTSILLTLVPTVTINVFSIVAEKNWRQALRDYWPIPAFTIVGSFTGTQLLLSVDPEPFRFLLAGVLIAYLVSDFFHRAEHRIEVPKWGMALFGLLLGLLAGVVNIFAPLVVAYALFTRMPGLLMVATFNLSFITSKSGQIIGFISRGEFDLGIVKIAVVGLPFILVALWLGILIRKRVDMSTYQGMLRIALWLMSIAILIDAVRRMWGE